MGVFPWTALLLIPVNRHKTNAKATSASLVAIADYDVISKMDQTRLLVEVLLLFLLTALR